MSHQISTRALSPEEQRKVRPRLRGVPDLLMNLAMTFVISLGAAMGGGVLAYFAMMLISFIIGPTELEGDLPLIVMALTFPLAWTYLFIRIHRWHKNMRGDKAGAVAEVIDIENSRWVRNEEATNESPEYYFDIGDGKILVLGGQWLWDFPTYGLEHPENEDTEESVPFPCSSFRVHRLQNHGLVLRIDLLSPPIPPEGEVPDRAKLPAWLTKRTDKMDWLCSLLVEGPYDELREKATIQPGT